MILLVVVVILITLYCIRKCKSNRGREERNVVLNLNELSREHENALNGNNRTLMNKSGTDANQMSHDEECDLETNFKDKLTSAEIGTLTDDIAMPVKKQFSRR